MGSCTSLVTIKVFFFFYEVSQNHLFASFAVYLAVMSCHAVMAKLIKLVKAWTFVHETQITVACKLMLLSAKHFGMHTENPTCGCLVQLNGVMAL